MREKHTNTLAKEKALKHPIYNVIPRHRKQIHWFDIPRWLTWALLGNDDDGVFGEDDTNFDLNKEVKGSDALKWGVRNPLHNLTFYILGSAYTTNSEFTIVQLAKDDSDVFEYSYPATTVFAGKGSSFYLGLHGWKPFLSFRLNYGRNFDFYLGWRERGNLGLKLLPSRRRKED